MGWEYSDFSHKAKGHGGPQKYIEQIENYARQETNRKWLKGAVPLALITIPFAVKGLVNVSQAIIPKIKQLSGQDTVTLEEAQNAKKELEEHFTESEEPDNDIS